MVQQVDRNRLWLDMMHVPHQVVSISRQAMIYSYNLAGQYMTWFAGGI